MPNKFIFADEARCFSLTGPERQPLFHLLCGRYGHVQQAAELLNLRRKLAWDGFEFGDAFHVSEDRQAVREAAKDGLGCPHCGLPIPSSSDITGLP
jgi:hypothetical protein